MRRYLKLGFYFSKEIFYYTYTLVVGNIELIVLVFVLNSLVLYGATASGMNNVAGISLSLYVRYVFITELLMTNYRNDDLTEEIKNGSIVTYLNKPISFVFYYLSNSFFKTLNKTLIIGPSVGILVYLVFGSFPWFGIEKFLLFLVSLIVGVLLLSLFHLIMGLAAFVSEDARAMRMLTNKLYLIFGGVFFPIDIYPLRLQTISQYLPFQYFIYSPAKFFATGDTGFFLSYFGIQILRCFLILGLILVAYNFLVKRLEINGG